MHKTRMTTHIPPWHVRQNFRFFSFPPWSSSSTSTSSASSPSVGNAWKDGPPRQALTHVKVEKDTQKRHMVCTYWKHEGHEDGSDKSIYHSSLPSLPLQATFVMHTGFRFNVNALEKMIGSNLANSCHHSRFPFHTFVPFVNNTSLILLSSLHP